MECDLRKKIRKKEKKKERKKNIAARAKRVATVPAVGVSHSPCH